MTEANWRLARWLLPMTALTVLAGAGVTLIPATNTAILLPILVAAAFLADCALFLIAGGHYREFVQSGFRLTRRP
jgi:hypothetical protein